MEITTPQFETSQRHLIDLETYKIAPIALLGAFPYLVGTQEVVASLCQCREVELETEWRAALLTETRLIYMTATKDARAWNVESKDQSADASHASARYLSDIAELRATEMSATAIGGRWHWRAALAVEFRQGGSLSLPLFDGPPHREIVAPVERFGMELKARL